jgi:DNA-directed RNA polymerase subunit RPC12/RpoP
MENSVSEVYLCASCGKCFDIHKAVDGYPKFRKGFLCPICGRNIIETGSSNKDITQLRFGYSYLIFSIIVYILIAEDILLISIFKHELIDTLVTGLIMLLLPTPWIVYANKNILFNDTIIYTKIVITQK